MQSRSPSHQAPSHPPGLPEPSQSLVLAVREIANYFWLGGNPHVLVASDHTAVASGFLGLPTSHTHKKPLYFCQVCSLETSSGSSPPEHSHNWPHWLLSSQATPLSPFCPLSYGQFHQGCLNGHHHVGLLHCLFPKVCTHLAGAPPQGTPVVLLMDDHFQAPEGVLNWVQAPVDW